ncbi:phosphoribosyl-ATP pyrophosphohydrolase [Halobacillus sp. SY10]|uniref:phosphoribosyl-ATP pyrophosphohydrolase n=1 Tax=Halobacillus sp. SY10 TaxID=3381356 RepID=UPI003879FF66
MAFLSPYQMGHLAGIGEGKVNGIPIRIEPVITRHDWKTIHKGWITMPIYNKLVRDKIPDIIAKSGKSYEIQHLSDKAYVKELERKLVEETEEYLETGNDEESVEELADFLELVRALAVRHGCSFDELEDVRRRKAEERGAFKERIYLVEVEDES